MADSFSFQQPGVDRTHRAWSSRRLPPAARHGILCTPSAITGPARPGWIRPGLVMGYSKLTLHQTEAGIQRLASIA